MLSMGTYKSKGEGMVKSLNDAQLLVELEKRLADISQAQLARKYRITAGYLNDVLHGRTVPGPKIFEGMGYKRVVRYVPKG